MPQSFTLNKLAKLVSGELMGDSSAKVSNVSEIESSKEDDLVFVLESRNLSAALSSKAGAIIAQKGTKISKKNAILVDNPRLAMSQILSLFAPPCEVEDGVHKTAVVHKTAKLGKNIRIGALVYIGPNAEVGDNTIVYPNVTIYARTKIGKNCTVHGGARIGMDGYGFALVGGRFEKIPQIGRVVIEDDVEIYANTCVARGTIGDTVIKRGTKIDNLTHIAHNCKIGEDCAITGLVGFAGSVTVGNHVSVGGQAGFSGHQTIGDNAVIMARTGITKDIPPNSVVSGFPAVDHKRDMEIQALLRRLPQILKKLKIK